MKHISILFLITAASVCAAQQGSVKPAQTKNVIMGNYVSGTGFDGSVWLWDSQEKVKLICQNGAYLSIDGRCLHDRTGESTPSGDGCNSSTCSDPACHYQVSTAMACLRGDDPDLLTHPTVPAGEGSNSVTFIGVDNNPLIKCRVGNGSVDRGTVCVLAEGKSLVDVVDWVGQLSIAMTDLITRKGLGTSGYSLCLGKDACSKATNKNCVVDIRPLDKDTVEELNTNPPDPAWMKYVLNEQTRHCGRPDRLKLYNNWSRKYAIPQLKGSEK